LQRINQLGDYMIIIIIWYYLKKDITLYLLLVEIVVLYMLDKEYILCYVLYNYFIESLYNAIG